LLRQQLVEGAAAEAVAVRPTVLTPEEGVRNARLGVRR